MKRIIFSFIALFLSCSSKIFSLKEEYLIETHFSSLGKGQWFYTENYDLKLLERIVKKEKIHSYMQEVKNHQLYVFSNEHKLYCFLWILEEIPDFPRNIDGSKSEKPNFNFSKKYIIIDSINEELEAIGGGHLTISSEKLLDVK